jgi:hypothetical protein
MWTGPGSAVSMLVATWRRPVLFPESRSRRPAAAQPWRIQLSCGSDPDAADALAGWCWQSHHVPPGQSS